MKCKDCEYFQTICPITELRMDEKFVTCDRFIKKMNKYIHYGSKEFSLARFTTIKNRQDILSKPTGGLWASPINSSFGWKEWCECEDFAEYEEDNCFIFSLNDNAKVLHIKSKEDVQNLPQIDTTLLEYRSIGMPFDFEKIATMYDAIEINFSQNLELHDYFWGWDCDTLLVMNPKIIKTT